jgi:phospholipid/cholesterol/gamma-HCH transport system permease protein
MEWVAELGSATGRSVAYVGGLAEILGKSLWLLFLSPLKRARMLQRAVHEAMAVGVGAIPIVSLITFFVGVIIALQGAYELQRLGAMQIVASLVAISITRELGSFPGGTEVSGHGRHDAVPGNLGRPDGHFRRQPVRRDRRRLHL